MEAWSLNDILEHAAHVAVNIGYVELAILNGIDNLLHLCGLSGLHQVVAGMHLAGCGKALADTNPVGHHDALIAPILTQNLGQQVVVTHRVLAVYLII